MKEASWPIFIAAPFMRPSVVDHLLGRLEVPLLERLGGLARASAPMLAARVPA